jgi:VWFA-related protein
MTFPTRSLSPLSVIFTILVVLLLGTGVARARQAPAAKSDAAKPSQVIRSGIDLVTSDVIVRDARGKFISDLKPVDFEVYEDGVRQEIVTFLMSHGGRIFGDPVAVVRRSEEGIVVPAPRPTGDRNGRVFLVFFDDLHLDVRSTPRLRDLFKKISRELIHDGDMFAIVSTGPSSLAIDFTYDRKRLDEAVKHMSGGGLRPSEILSVPQGQQGSPEVRHRAHVAFATAYDILDKMAAIRDRRKAVIYLSNGYDFDPFAETRGRQETERSPRPPDSNDQSQPKTNQFAFADLISQLSEVTRAANRANASIFTIDPRGLSAGPDLDEPVSMVEWNAHLRTSQDTLRVLAEQTGGVAAINRNDFTAALKRIDSETSDYYMIGYSSSNPDPLKRHRQITVRVKKPDLEVTHRREYSLKPPPDKVPRLK